MRLRPVAKQRVNVGLPTRTVSENLKRLRNQLGLSVRTLSARSTRYDASGVVSGRLSANAISEIENGQRRVDVDDLILLSMALDVSPAVLLMPDPQEQRERSDGGFDVVYLLDPDEMLPSNMVWGWLTAQEPLRDAQWWESLEEGEYQKPESERRWYDNVMRESWRRRSVPRFAWERGESSDG